MLHTVPKNEFSSKDFFIKCQQILTSIGISSCLLMASFNKKLPEAVVWKCSEKRCSENMQQIYRRASMPKFDFKNVALQFYWNHTEKTPIFLIFIFWSVTAWKVSKCGVFSGPYFSVFGLNKRNVCIESEYRKIRTRKNSVFVPFACSECYSYFGSLLLSFLSLLCFLTQVS